MGHDHEASALKAIKHLGRRIVQVFTDGLSHGQVDISKGKLCVVRDELVIDLLCNLLLPGRRGLLEALDRKVKVKVLMGKDLLEVVGIRRPPALVVQDTLQRTIETRHRLCLLFVCVALSDLRP